MRFESQRASWGCTHLLQSLQSSLDIAGPGKDGTRTVGRSVWWSRAYCGKASCCVYLWHFRFLKYRLVDEGGDSWRCFLEKSIEAALVVVEWIESRRSEFLLFNGPTDIQTFYIPACSITISKACYPCDKATPSTPFLRTQTGSLSSVMLEDDYDCEL